MNFLGITPSALPRLAHCLGGAALPHDSSVSESMRRGTAIHAYLQHMADGVPQPEALARVPQEWRDDCAAIPLDKLPPLTSGLSEVGMAWNLSTGECRVLGVGLSREASRAACREGEMPMVVDWVADVSDAATIVADWKTGFQSELAPTAENLQILTYGAVYLLATAREEAHLYLCRPDRDSPRWDGPVVMDALAAEAHLDRVRELVGKAQAAREDFVARGVLPHLAMGPWCAWCPARFRCPAHVGALVAVMEGDAERCVANVMELSQEQAGALWSELRFAEKLAGALRKKLENIAREIPLPVPAGGWLAEDTETDEEIVPAAAADWLRIRYGEQVASAVVRPEATWARLEETLVAHVLPELKLAHEEGRAAGRVPTKAALLREVRTGLRSAGAVKLTTRRVVKVVQVAPALPTVLREEG